MFLVGIFLSNFVRFSILCCHLLAKEEKTLVFARVQSKIRRVFLLNYSLMFSH